MNSVSALLSVTKGCLVDSRALVAPCLTLMGLCLIH